MSGADIEANCTLASSSSLSSSSLSSQTIPEKIYCFPSNCINPVTKTSVFNFAFGSNISPIKLESRGLTVLSSFRAILRGHRLRFNQLGYPPGVFVYVLKYEKKISNIYIIIK